MDFATYKYYAVKVITGCIMFSFDKMEHYYDLIIYNIWKRFNFYDESQILILGILSGFEIQDLD